MFLHVSSFTHLGEYKLRVVFNNATVKDVDLKHELDGKIFVPLRDLGYFRKVFLNPDTQTIEWPNGADFAPEFLDEIGALVQSEAEMAG